MARPTLFSQVLGDQILDQISSGRSLVAICSASDMPDPATVYRWLAKHPEFCENYVRARETLGHVYADRALAVASTPKEGVTVKLGGPNGEEHTYGDMVARSKLEVDTLKWAAEKLSPKVYGNKQFVEHSGSITLTDMSDEDLVAEMLELLTKGVVQLPAGAEIEVLDEPDEEDFSDLA